MKKFKKILLIFSLGIVVLVAAVLGFTYTAGTVYFKPKYSGKISIPGLKNQAYVYYDDYGIPHINADNREDMYKAYGYVIAQDRMFQLQLQKRIGSGRLSEWFGSATLDADKFLRTVGLRRWTQKWFEENKQELNPNMMLDLQAWLDGVNECIKSCARPLEMTLLQAQPEPLDVDDVLAFSAMMSFSFTKSYWGDVLLNHISQSVNAKEMSEITNNPAAGWTNLFAANSPTSLIPSISTKYIAAALLLPNFDGSQSWVISPKKSSSGHATLANDPHIGFSNPGIWYEAHLKSKDFEIYGHFVPIIPFPLLGHNATKAWALTMSNSDEIDIVKLNETTETTKYEEEIKVKNASNEKIQTEDSALGPVINEVFVKAFKPNERLAMHWHYYHANNFVLDTFYDLAYAKNVDEFQKAVKRGHAPGLNISWADKEGHIAWRILGFFPKRTKPHWSILNEEDINADYLAGHPETETPQVVDPAQGYILSANQKPPFPFNETNINGYWDGSDRFKTLHQEFLKVNNFNLEYQRKMFFLNNVHKGKERLKTMLSEIGITSWDEKLNAWDGKAQGDTLMPAIYYAWMEKILFTVLDKQLSQDQIKQFCETTMYWNFVTGLVDHPESTWWQGKRSELLKQAYESALHDLASNFGPQENWGWNKVHTIEFENILGKKKPLNRVFNLGPFPVNGGFMIPNAFKQQNCSGSFKVVAGASTRRLIDFANPLESQGILPTGNSGVIFSPHYNDQSSLYLSGQLRPQLMDWNKIKLFSNRLVFSSK